MAAGLIDQITNTTRTHQQRHRTMAALKFFNSCWDHVHMWSSDHRYHQDGHGNVFVQHNEANQDSWVEVMGEDQAREFFVGLIHNGWQQRLYLDSFMDELLGNDPDRDELTQRIVDQQAQGA